MKLAETDLCGKDLPSCPADDGTLELSVHGIGRLKTSTGRCESKRRGLLLGREDDRTPEFLHPMGCHPTDVLTPTSSLCSMMSPLIGYDICHFVEGTLLGTWNLC